VEADVPGTRFGVISFLISAMLAGDLDPNLPVTFGTSLALL